MMIVPIHMYIVTRNKSIITTTLHTAMNLHMLCMSVGIPLEVRFVSESEKFTNLHKYIKATAAANARLVWIDYGVTTDVDTIKRLAIDDIPDNYKILTVSCVTEGVDWKQFRERTAAASADEPVHQRGLKFDLVANSTEKNKVSEYVSGEPRVFCMDAKAVFKKLDSGPIKSFEMSLKKNAGLKIGVLRSATVTCHYVYECTGNILDSLGVSTGP